MVKHYYKIPPEKASKQTKAEYDAEHAIRCKYSNYQQRFGCPIKCFAQEWIDGDHEIYKQSIATNNDHKGAQHWRFNDGSILRKNTETDEYLAYSPYEVGILDDIFSPW